MIIHLLSPPYSSYYPLLPPFRKEDQQAHGARRGDEGKEGEEVQEEPTEVNLDIVHAFESQYAVLPARPDILFLPSDLKPFAKVRMCSLLGQASN